MLENNLKVHFRFLYGITLRMVSPIFGLGGNLTTDDWYSRVPLAEEVLKKKVTSVGTMRKNKITSEKHSIKNNHTQKSENALLSI